MRSILAKQHVYIITDELEAFSGFLEELRETARFSALPVDLSFVLSEDFIRQTQGIRRLDLVLALHESVYRKERQRLQEQFRTAFRHGFTNVILFNTTGILDDEDIRLGKTHCFYLDQKTDRKTLTLNFLLYSIKVFNEAVLSDRLQDYIINTVESIVDSEMLKKEKEEVERLNEELEQKNRTDTLTCLYNRQAVFEALDREMKRVHRHVWRLNHAQESNERIDVPDTLRTGVRNLGTPAGTLMDHFGFFSVMMVDIDHFKQVNDVHGHMIGDTVLHAIGKLLNRKNIFRETDILGRFGGEEFIGIFPETKARHVMKPVERFVSELSRMEFIGLEGAPFRVSISVGISEFSLSDNSTEDVITRADKALYWAKANGRNRIAVYDEVFPDQKIVGEHAMPSD